MFRFGGEEDYTPIGSPEDIEADRASLAEMYERQAAEEADQTFGAPPDMDPMVLRNLFKRAEAGDVEATRQLINQGPPPEMMTPPPTPEQGAPIQGMSLADTERMPNASQRVGIAPQSRPGMEMAPQPSPGNPLNGGGNPLTSPGQPTGKKTNWGDVAKSAFGAIAPLAIGAIAGDAAGGGFGQGYNSTALSDIRQRQQREYERNAQVWQDQYELAKSLPQEVFQDQNMAELANAAQAFAKDMADGKIDNPKTSSAFMMAHSKYKDDVDKIIKGNQLKQDIEALTQKAQIESQAMQETWAKAGQMLKNPWATPEELANANAMLSTQPVPYKMPDGKVIYTTPDKAQSYDMDFKRMKLAEEEMGLRRSDQAADAAYRKESLGLQREQINASKEIAGFRNDRLVNREKAQAAVAGFNTAVDQAAAKFMETEEGKAKFGSLANAKLAAQSAMLQSPRFRGMAEQALGFKYGRVKGPNGEELVGYFDGTGEFYSPDEAWGLIQTRGSARGGYAEF
jgi:hypothetical protein